MKFGKLEHIDGLSFLLPPTHPTSAKVLPGVPAAQLQLRIGCSVWSEKGYKARIFPPKTSQKQFLTAYGKQLSTVELNGTHYYLPRPEVVESWKSAVPDGFLFCPKVPQFISHRKDMLGNPEMIEQFLLRMLALEDHLGISFMQLPPYFGPDRLPQLAALLEYLPKDFQLALELRHPAWFTDPVAQDELFALMEACGVHPVIADVTGRRDVLHMRLSTTKVLIRFNGCNLHPSDFQRLDAWAGRLQEWVDAGLQEVHFFMHQSEQGYGADLALYLIRKLNENAALALPEPVWYGEPVLF